MLRVDRPAPEDQPVAEAGLQSRRVHALGADLHRIEDVDAVVQQVGNVRGARAAGVIPNLRRRCASGCTAPGRFCRGLTRRPVDSGPEQRARLAGQVVADHDHVNQVAHLVKKQAEPIEPEVERLVEQGLAKLRCGQQVHEPAFQTTQIPADFVHHAGDAADHGVGRILRSRRPAPAGRQSGWDHRPWGRGSAATSASVASASGWCEMSM